MGRLDESPYFRNYERLPISWRLTAGEVDGELVVVVHQAGISGCSPRAAVRLQAMHGRLTPVTDYWHCPWVLSATSHISADPPS